MQQKNSTVSDNVPKESLIGRFRNTIANLISSSKAVPASQPEDTTAPDEFDSMPWRQGYGRISGTIGDIVVHRDRYHMAQDCWNMYMDDDRVGGIIDGIAEDATEPLENGTPFAVTVDEESNRQDQTQATVEAICGRDKVELWDQADERIRGFLLDGSRFYRIVVDVQQKIVSELRYIKGPKEGFVTVEIDYDLMLEGRNLRGWYMQIEWMSQKIVAVFEPWEIIHFCWNKIGHYGLPLMRSARKNFKRLEKTEYDLWLARKERAYMKLSHKFPDLDEEQIKRLIQAQEEAKKSSGVDTDYYTTGGTDVLEARNSALFNIDDVRYAERKLLVSGKRPPGLLGYDVNNRSVLERQEHRYVSGFIPKVEMEYEKGIRKAINIELLLQGYLPEMTSYDLQWKNKSLEDKNALGKILVEAGKLNWIGPGVFRNTLGISNEDAEADLKRYYEFMGELEDQAGSVMDLSFTGQK